MHKTKFAGLTELDPGDDLTVDGASFTETNPSVTDLFLRIGAVTHRHDAHAPIPDPTIAPSASAAASGGQIAADTTVFVAYTLLDTYGGETRRGIAAQTTTPGGISPPSAAINATFDASGGTLPVGQYAYALTYSDPGGGESTLGPTAFVTRSPGYPSGQVDLSGLATELGAVWVSWNLWRAEDGGDYQVIASGATDTFVDTGFACTDASRTPPADMSTVLGTNVLYVQIPTAIQDPSIGGAASIALYLSLDGSFATPSLYDTYPVASAGATITIPQLITKAGSPPVVSHASQGANQIDPDTDLLDWHWKRPVATSAALGSGATGDVRVALDTGYPWIVLGSAAHVAADWTDWFSLVAGGGGGGGGAVGVGGSGAVPLIDPVSYIEFTGSGAAVHVTDLGGGSARVAVGAGQIQASAGGASAFVSPGALLFAGASGVKASLQDLGGGSALITVSPDFQWNPVTGFAAFVDSEWGGAGVVPLVATFGGMGFMAGGLQTTASGAAWTTLFTLPVGAWPRVEGGQTPTLGLPMFNASTGADAGTLWCDFGIDGTVQPVTNVPNNVVIILDSVSYRI